MEMFEKVDTLRSRANVSYEDAKNALDRSNGDILDAMILLEREGKARNSGNAGFNNEFTAAAGNNCTNKSFSEKMKSLFHKSTVNYLVIDHKGERLLKIPVLAAVLVFFFAFPAAVIALVVSLFLDCRYSFTGQSDMEFANEFCSKAGDLAGQVKDKVVSEYNSL